MQIDELYTLSKWYMKNVNSLNLPHVFANVNTVIKNTLVKKNPSLLKNQSEQQFKNIKGLLEKIDYTDLTDNQRRCLIHLNLDSVITESAIAHFERLLLMVEDDANYVITTLDGYIKLLQKAATAFSQINNQLPIVIENQTLLPIEVPEGKVLTRITFHNEASINNLVEFNNWAKSWNMIARGFSMSVGEAPETFEVVNADRGSFIVDLVVGAEAMKVLFEALKAFTDLAISITDLTAKLTQARELRNAVSEETYAQFVEEAERNIEEEEQRIVEKVIEHLENKNLIQVPQAKNDLARSIKEIYKFNASGGTMHCLASNDDTFDEQSVVMLNESYRQLQDKSELKLIEDKKTEKGKDGWL
ncbi:hypothetical protein WOC08_16385 [Vibrio parahaemolyticus]|uniref:hypothetical protein n=1 Tax=Vibrio parahaemolyticus TaxID=670 RepID=UPI0023EAB2D7|nr:hypothetical protein [Vibrio parahaemolyticus]MCF9444313.1 hypothetical protein [Vibrio parahaemolyticus]MDF5418902.1 hypothetical protein [Vibrio parahaemolyticus]MDF5445332.1 hypothetical protein [Vibrio parahaemolyticus]HCE2586965.1 hypothetical protein [Vibrio parahaemolyticus]